MNPIHPVLISEGKEEEGVNEVALEDEEAIAIAIAIADG